VHEKLGRVEYFKSDNALTRNSLMYLTRSVAILDADAEAQQLPSQESARLQQSLLRFVETLDPASGEQINAELDLLTRKGTGSGMPLLIAHGRLIVKVLPGVDELLRQITGASTTEPAKAFESALLQFDSQAEARAQVLRYALYFFSLMLFGYLVHQFAQIRSAAISLRAANNRLQLEMFERAHAEVDLRMNEERYRAITQFANEAIISVDKTGHIVSWNVGATTIFGRNAEDAMHKPLSLLMPKRLRRTPERTFLHWREGTDAQPWMPTFEAPGVRSDGTEIALEISRSTWSTAQGEFETGIIRDVTVRKRLEETTRQQEMQLIQANKVTAVGTLVLGAAHDIDNPNHSIMTNAASLANAWPDALAILDRHAEDHGAFAIGGLPYAEMRDRMPALTRDIDVAARHIAGIVDDLKDFGRAQQPGREATLRVNDAVGRTLRLLRWRIDQRTTRCQAHLADALPPARGDSGQIEQILTNLLTNALDALPDPSRGITVLTALAPDRQQILLVVHDEGDGIAPEHLAHVFDPFFTTKQASGGTGLGLAISASLARANGASLEIAPDGRRGTRATLALRCAVPAEQPVH